MHIIYSLTPCLNISSQYAMLIPALLMGNTVVMKLPAIGGLAHILTAKAYAEHLPAGVLNFVSGSGRMTCTPMSTMTCWTERSGARHEYSPRSL